MEYIICFDKDAPWSDYDEVSRRETGVLADLIRFVSKNANFSYIASPLKYRNWPQMLLSGECDICVGTYSMHEQLAYAFKYSTSFHISQVRILSGVSKQRSAISYLDINITVGFGMIAALILLSILTYFIQQCLHKFDTNNRRPIHLFNAFWIYFSCCFAENVRTNQLFRSAKVLLITWLVMLILLLSMIGGSLKADTSINRKRNIDTLDDILKKPSLKLLVGEKSNIHYFFNRSENPVVSALWKRILKMKSLITWTQLEDYLKDVKYSKSVLITEDLYIYRMLHNFYREDFMGKFYLSSTSFFETSYHIFMSDDVEIEHLESFNAFCTYFAATVQMMPGVRTYTKEAEKCFEERQPQRHNELSSLIFVWLTGLSFASFFLVIEIFIHRLCP